ncbi:hypothetical protein G6L37_34655 [Agrobacterium rubi]|nr:hypothetical protein [Agrobacterium rubi]NTF23709.1 hypothetical protein [Agrobacterium rubi]
MIGMSLAEAVTIARSRIEFSQREIVRLTNFVADARRLMGDLGDPELPKSTTHEILSASEQILEECGTPQSKGVIYDALVARGINVPGSSPRGNLTAKFASRKDVFRFDRPTRLWSLTKWSQGQLSDR